MKITNKIIKTKESFDNLIEGLKINEENFKIQYSSSKLVVINENLKYTYYPNKLNNIKGLHFIKKVKDYILKNEIKYTFDKKIVYNSINVTLKNSVNYKKELYEVDLRAAYWHLAYKNNFINEGLYKEGLKVDKKIRLMALGSLAKNINEFNYNGGLLINTEKIKSELTEGIFFKVAFDTDVIMRKLISVIPKEAFMFYWVDAVFFRGKENLKKITEHLENIEMFYKIVEIKKIIKKSNKFEVEDFDYKKRDFNFIKKTSIKTT